MLTEVTLAMLTSVVTLSSGHVTMNVPPSWSDPDGLFGMTDNFRNAGCIKGTGRPGSADPDGTEGDAKHCIMKWYTNYTFHTGNATLPEHMRTFNVSDSRNPWYAPGTAPTFSPCGIDGGNPHGCPPGNPDPFACAGGGRGHGDDGRTLKGNTKPAEWTLGNEEEVAYAVEANHGGGYQYRLCPKPTNYMDLTEECFMKTPLTLGNESWVQWHGDKHNRSEFAPLRTTVGTTPAGSQWSRNAIPACAGLDGGVLDFPCILGSQFTPPAPGVYGFWGVHNFGTPSFGWGRIHTVSIVDKVQVPDVPPGDYVLQFRYDAEQTSQVWNACADVRISKPKPFVAV